MMRTILAPVLVFTCAGLLSADVLFLRDGRSINGRLVSATSRQIRFLEDGQRTSRLHQVTAVERVAFGDAGRTSSGASNSRANGSSTRDSGAYSSRPDSSRPDSTTRARTGRYSVAEGSVITVRMIDSVNSDQTNVGDTYRASLESPIVVDGQTIAPRGADATVRIARVDQSGTISGREEVALVLNDISVNGRRYRIESENATVAANSRSNESAKVIGGGAVVGAIIGAIAGGGKGAAIGAATGAGAGAAVQAVRGQKIEIPSESMLDFRLAQPLFIE
jgi:hypothetical protein